MHWSVPNSVPWKLENRLKMYSSTKIAALYNNARRILLAFEHDTYTCSMQFCVAAFNSNRFNQGYWTRQPLGRSTYKLVTKFSVSANSSRFCIFDHNQREPVLSNCVRSRPPLVRTQVNGILNTLAVHINPFLKSRFEIDVHKLLNKFIPRGPLRMIHIPQ